MDKETELFHSLNVLGFFSFQNETSTLINGKLQISRKPKTLNHSNWDEVKEKFLNERAAKYPKETGRKEFLKQEKEIVDAIEKNLTSLKAQKHFGSSKVFFEKHLEELLKSYRTLLGRKQIELAKPTYKVVPIEVNYKLDLKAFSFNYDLDYFYNASNIPNQELVFATIDHFKSKERSELFSPLHFLNLLWKQQNFIKENVNKAYSVLQTLKAIPLKPLESHILFGFLLKWFGGYPVENLNENYNSTLRLIEREFLSFTEDTIEREFCKRSYDKYLMYRNLEKWVQSETQKRHKPNEIEHKQAEIKEPEKPKFTFENNFSAHLPEVTYQYFKEKLVNKKAITEEDLKRFLKAAFEDLKPLPQKLVLKGFLKKESRTVFRDFRGQIGIRHNDKHKYVDLLCDYFEGHEKTNTERNWAN